MTVDEFRRELVGVPLCGTPELGQFAGKMLCTVHLPDGTAILARAGHGGLRPVGGRAAGRSAAATPQDPPDRRRCVTYERVGRSHFRNSDGVGFCLGPCEGDNSMTQSGPVFGRSCSNSTASFGLLLREASTCRMIHFQNHAGRHSMRALIAGVVTPC